VRPPFPGIALGCDYNPEQWPRSVWREDVELMRRAGVGFVTVGVFSWAWLQPEPDRYDFAWLDEVLELLAAAGVAVDLATATASPPPWLTAAHPEILPVDASGARLWPGSRQSYCPSSPVFREHALRLVGELARRYHDHPALRLWHVGNELGAHVARCWCDVSAAAFRDWLARRHGTVDALNEAWGTSFWSQRYSGFHEVLPPRLTPAQPNPTQELDFARFCSDELLAHYRAERDLLREHSPGVPVTTNLTIMAHQSGQDYFRWAPELDLVAQDHYLDHRLPDPHAERAFAGDLTRGVAGGGPWLLMESAPGAVNWQPVNPAKPPGGLLTDSLAHVARGADGVGFFQWRASRAGAEKFHSALVPHAGPDSAAFRAVLELGAVLGRLGELAGSRVEPHAALLFDWEAWWACDLGSHPSSDLHYLDAAHDWHRALTGLGLTVDVRPPWTAAAELSRYPLVVVPTLYLSGDATTAALAGYVAGGGQLLVTYFSGIVDPQDHVRLGGYPGAFRELLGVRGEEFHPLLPGQVVPLTAGPDAAHGDAHHSDAHHGDAGDRGPLDGAGATLWTERLTAPAAEVLARYAAGPLTGTPALTRRPVGAGAAWYLATRPDPAGRARLASRLAQDAGLTTSVLPAGAEVVRRRADDGRSWLFVVNHADTAVRVPVEGTDLVSGTTVDDGAVLVAPGGVAVIAEPAAGR
jgi:beta-galactosidase